MATGNVTITMVAEPFVRCLNFVPVQMASDDTEVLVYVRCRRAVNHHVYGERCEPSSHAATVWWEWNNDPRTRATNEAIQRIIEQSPRLDARGVEALLGDMSWTPC